MDINKVLIIYIQPIEKEEKDTLDIVTSTLKDNNVKFELMKREELKKISEMDLVIVVGGDGTLLRTAHYVKNQLVLGVNCLCSIREGFFLKADLRNFKKRFELLLNDKHKILELSRIKAVIEGKETVPALNEIYVGEKKSYRVSKYYIKAGNKEEFQKSSGVLIATAAGSSAWLKSAGGKVLDTESGKVQYLVREPYKGKLLKPTLLKGDTNKDFEITSLMEDGIVVIDSTSQEYDFKKGKRLKIINAEPLRLVDF